MLATDYSVLLYEGLGYKGSIPLLLAASYVTVACVGNFVNALLIDRIGRVKLLRKSHLSARLYTRRLIS
jgi:hypothetical protein